MVYGTAGAEKAEVCLGGLLPLLVYLTAGPEKTEVCLGGLLPLLVYGTAGPEKAEVWLVVTGAAIAHSKKIMFS